MDVVDLRREPTMSRVHEPAAAELEASDRTYRAAGLRAMAPVDVHYSDPVCPHEGCGHRMEWIAFRLGSRDGDDRLIRSWWEGAGFVGRCPKCRGWIRFRTLGMSRVEDDEAARLPRLADDWHSTAKFA
jgi:hypothetical protein